MFLNFTNMLTSLNIYYACVMSLPLGWSPRGSKQGNLSLSLVSASGLGAMENKKSLVCTRSVSWLFFLVYMLLLCSNPLQNFYHNISSCETFFCTFIIFGMNEWYLCLFQIHSLFISVYDLLDLSSCATLKIAIHVDIICAI